MIHLKNNPVGVDVPIQKCQVILDENLSWNGYEIYGRLYTNTKNNKKIIEYFKGGIEYTEAFVDDSTAKIGFIVSPLREGFQGNIAEIYLICSADLTKIYGSQLREDEKAIMEIASIVQKVSGFKIIDIKSGNISDIFSQFMDTSTITYRDMQPFVNFYLHCKVNYLNNFCKL